MVDKEIKLDVWKENNIVLYANQGEVDARFLKIIILSNGNVIDLSGKTVELYAVKPDGNLIFNNCIVLSGAQGQAYVGLTSQMSCCTGMLECEIHIIGDGNSLLKIKGVKIIVIPCENFDSAVESSSEFTELNKAISEVKEIMNQYSEENIMAKITKYDGDRSGLDADMLDGKHASDYATSEQGETAESAVQGIKVHDIIAPPDSGNIVNLTHGNMKTVSIERKINNKSLSNDVVLSYKDVGAFPELSSCLSGIDYDTLTQSGFYQVEESPESPNLNSPKLKGISGNYHVTVLSGSQGNVRQIACSCESDNNIYIRVFSNGEWSSWKKLYSESNIPSYQDMGDVPIANGGMGANSISGALNNLGIPIESGSWTPILSARDGSAPTYSVNYLSSAYLRINNLVYISFHGKFHISNTGTGYATVNGLPYIAANNTGKQAFSNSEVFGLASQAAVGYTDNLRSDIIVQNITGETAVRWAVGDVWIGYSGCYLKN